MEILEASAPIMNFASWQGIAIIVLIIGISCALGSWTIDSEAGIIAGSILCGVAILTMFFAPWQVPTGKYSTTIEITDKSKYEELINANYDFTRVYENRDIYVITGDEIE